MTAAPTVVIGTPPPTRVGKQPGRLQQVVTALAVAAATHPGEWVHMSALPTSCASRAKDRLIAQFGDRLEFRYARCRPAGNTRDLYVRMCCKTDPVAAVCGVGVSDVVASMRRPWFKAVTA